MQVFATNPVWRRMLDFPPRCDKVEKACVPVVAKWGFATRYFVHVPVVWWCHGAWMEEESRRCGNKGAEGIIGCNGTRGPFCGYGDVFVRHVGWMGPFAMCVPGGGHMSCIML